MDYQFITMITGFIAILLTIVNLNNGIRIEINNLRKEFKEELNRVEDRINRLETKLDTFLLALFKGQNFNPEHKDAA